MDYTHSVELDKNLCIGCTDCIKRCPTEAIRVRNGKAVIINEKCIDCGLCIKVCTHKAKKAVTQHVNIIKNYKFKIAVPAPSLYGQFGNIEDVNIILTAIKQLGFDDVFEVSLAAEAVTEFSKKYTTENAVKKPIISSACPVIIKLISMRFPSLLENILPVISPVEVIAMAIKNYFVKEKGMNKSDIGVFFISPCASKNTYVINPLGIEKSEIDGVISIQELYLPLRNNIKNMAKIEKLMQSKSLGVNWAGIGGESEGVEIDNAIAVDGVENVIKVLEEVEDGLLEDVDFIEALACTEGCIGGPLTVTNPFVAKNRLKKVSKNSGNAPEKFRREKNITFDDIDYLFTKELKAVTALQLDDTVENAIKKVEEIRKIKDSLPCIDCGSCGSPTCDSLAEDIVRGNAHIEDCLFVAREKVKKLAEAMVDLSVKMPQSNKPNFDTEALRLVNEKGGYNGSI